MPAVEPKRRAGVINGKAERCGVGFRSRLEARVYTGTAVGGLEQAAGRSKR